MAEATNPFDQACRYLLRRGGSGLLSWLLRTPPSTLRFVRWLDTTLTLPGQPERVGDTIAHVVRLDQNELPWAIPVEFQVEPDSLMFGRMLGYESMIWLLEKPSALPGDRFCLQSVVVNLTGLGNCGRHMAWLPGAGTTLLPIEWNLETLDAAGVLEAIARGEAPDVLLAFISLMKRGGEPATIRRWLEIASQEQDPYRKADFALVVVFAELTECEEAWKKALEGFNVIESKIINEKMVEAATKSKIEAILDILAELGPIPVELEAKVRETHTIEVLRRWTVFAAKAESLDEFRRSAGL